MKSICIVAEAGINHDGSEERAIELVDVAADSGADYVKFQTFNVDSLITKSAPKAEYQKRSAAHESQFELLSRVRLTEQSHKKIERYCRDIGIGFMSTAFDELSLRFLVDELDMTKLKLPSGELTNAPLLLSYARAQRVIYVSTGMADIADVEDALGVLAFGLLGWNEPSKQNFGLAYRSTEGQRILEEKIVLLHCTTQYPTPLSDVNLNSMLTLKERFGLAVGYSDHTEGIIVPIAAAALGAQVIEKHFTLDRSLPGPDHQASLVPEELRSMVEKVRKVEKLLGDGVKLVQPSEKSNRVTARKSIVAAQNIKKGERLSSVNLTTKRPGTGRSPMDYWALLDSVATKNYMEDDLIL